MAFWSSVIFYLILIFVYANSSEMLENYKIVGSLHVIGQKLSGAVSKRITWFCQYPHRCYNYTTSDNW